MMIEKKCYRCGYVWKSIKINPIACPKCKRYDWHIERKEEEKE